MEAQPPPYAYAADPSAGYPPQQPGNYPTGGYDPAAQAGYAQQPAPGAFDTKPGVDAYGQPIGGYPTQQSGYPYYPTQATAPPPGYVGQQTATHTTVLVAQQPTVVAQVSPGLRPNNYLVLSIINLLFCFFVLGLIALIFSLQVDSAWSSGRYEEARRQSNIAKILNYVGIGLGIGAWAIVGIYVLAQIVISVAIVGS